MNIHKLELDVAHDMRSSVVISSLKDCVLEMVLNALDAKSKRIQIDVLSPFDAIITDDGNGMDPLEMKTGIGSRNCKLFIYLNLCTIDTSKCQNLTEFGHRGEALASIIQVANVTITSQRYHQAFQIVFHV